jgi:hypothetical protein
MPKDLFYANFGEQNLKTIRTARRTIKSRFLRFVVKISPVHKMQNSKFEARIEKFIREETQ